ncbi:hypothetical protein A2V71_02195 [Candidatus Berkelbacteria bacterium RBG_13_40_8]|uniref:O-antigen ligase-related domain-containing protein n=1 Tax=Candidatus Berkelbacteria bacterium RBG_13_40_8 TaxID=1797467 RepID=A0A1F5DQ01_9BACT|nr:MAG: hypothetical protein A2V71_02195 [Candidatus Berkelbacteria bacterium RBG_13_40_8]
MKYLIALIALALPTYLIRFDFGGIPTTLLEILIYVIFLIGLWKLAYCQWLKVRQTFWLPIGVLLLALIISTIIAPDKLAAAGQVRAYFIDPLLVFWLMICYLEIKDFSWIFLGLAGSGLFVSIHTIIQKILGHVTADGRVIGIFGYSPNYVALFLAPIIVMTVACGIQMMAKKSYQLSVISYLLSVISIVAIYFSGSRGGLIAVVGGIVFYLILRYWEIIRKKMLYKTAVLLLVTAAVFGTAWFFKPDFQASGGRVTSSNNLRWQIWGASFELGAKHPLLGVGLANFQPAFSDFTQDRGNFPEYITPQALTPHNIFLMFWLTCGILGLAAFIWLLVIFYKSGFKNLTKSWVLILMAAMTTIILQGLVDTPYFKNDLSILFWMILGSVLLLNYENKLN